MDTRDDEGLDGFSGAAVDERAGCDPNVDLQTDEDDWLSPRKLIRQAKSSDQELTIPNKMVKSRHKWIDEWNEKTLRVEKSARRADQQQDAEKRIAGRMSFPANISSRRQTRAGRKSVDVSTNVGAIVYGKPVSHPNVSDTATNESALARARAKIEGRKKSLQAAKVDSKTAIEEVTASTSPGNGRISLDRHEDAITKNDGRLGNSSTSDREEESISDALADIWAKRLKSANVNDASTVHDRIENEQVNIVPEDATKKKKNNNCNNSSIKISSSNDSEHADNSSTDNRSQYASKRVENIYDSRVVADAMAKVSKAALGSLISIQGRHENDEKVESSEIRKQIETPLDVSHYETKYSKNILEEDDLDQKARDILTDRSFSVTLVEETKSVENENSMFQGQTNLKSLVAQSNDDGEVSNSSSCSHSVTASFCSDDESTAGGRLWQKAAKEAELFSYKPTDGPLSLAPKRKSKAFRKLTERRMIPSTPPGEPKSLLRKYQGKADHDLIGTKCTTQVDVGSKQISTKFDQYRATAVVVLAILLGFLPSVFSQATCHFATGGVAVDGEGVEFDLHFGLWKYTPIENSFQGYNHCQPYSDQFYSSIPVFPRLCGLLGLTLGTIPLLVILNHLRLSNCNETFWNISIQMLVFGSACQLGTFIMFLYGVCQGFQCNIGPGANAAFVSALVWLIMAVEMKTNSPFSSPISLSDAGIVLIEKNRPYLLNELDTFVSKVAGNTKFKQNDITRRPESAMSTNHDNGPNRLAPNDETGLIDGRNTNYQPPYVVIV
ncbi:hypothetical protein ACHAXS_009259 [Conticribra weissflogii]